MAEEITSLVLKLVADTAGFTAGLASGARSATEFNQTMELARKAVDYLSTSFETFASVLERGQSVTKLTAAFENLQKAAGSLASDELVRLREATGGTVDNLKLMQEANEALLAGLTPERFRAVAEAADALGDSLGKGTVQALDELNKIASTGNEGLAKRFGILVETREAEEKFAKSINTTADALNEAGKKEAFRIAFFDELKKKQAEVGETAKTAQDRFEQLGVASKNLFDRLAQAVNENQSLAEAIDSLAKAIATIDVGKLVQVVDLFTTLASIPIKGITALGEGLGNAAREAADRVFNLSNEEQLREKLARLEQISDSFNQRSLLGRGPNFGASQQTEILRLSQEIGELQKLKDAANEAAFAASNLNGELYGPPKPSDDKNKYIDATKSIANAKAASQEALDQFKKDAEQTAFYITEMLDTLPFIGAKSSERDYQLEALDEAFQNSVDFFGDLLTPMFEGQAANFEDIFMDAAKRIAIGFASQMLANVAASFGLANIGGIGGAGGLGASLAATFGFGGGGTQPLGDFIGPVAGGATGAGLTVGGSSITSIVTTVAPYAAAAAAAYFAGSGISNVVQGNKLNIAEQAALSIPTFGGSFLFNPISDFFGFGGGGQKSREREAREALLDQLFSGNTSFQGTSGTLNLSAGNFNPSGKFDGKGTALVNPFAQILTGGDDKLGGDLAGIFENAVTEAETFNEAIINTRSLMGKLGISAEEAKQQVEELFLDGAISLKEFNADMENLNILSQDNLDGIGNVGDAIRILGRETATPRQQLTALGLAFGELAEIGVDSTTEIHDYITEQFGPDVAEVFDAFAAQGIDTFEEVQAVMNDPAGFPALLDTLNELKATFADVGSEGENAGNQIANGGVQGAQSYRVLRREADGARESIKKVAEEQRKLNGLVGTRGEQTLNSNNP